MNAIRKSISLTEREDQIIKNLSKATGINNYSIALRVIINEWAHDHEEPLSNQPGDPLQDTPK